MNTTTDVKLEVGMTVFLEPFGNNSRKEIGEYTVKTVGRKYFEVWRDEKEVSTIKFHLKDLRQVTNYTPTWLLYFSKQEILDKNEYDKLFFEIREAFQSMIFKTRNFSLEQLREIKSIIERKDA